MEISQHIGVDYNNGELFDVLTALNLGVLPISGRTYYVSKYGSGSDGLSWDKAFTTIAAAISASNTYIAVTENQYARNRIYIDGGGLWTEALTVFPNQCDMIGVGARTGWRPTISARTNIATAVLGCHIYNIAFNNTTNSVPVVKICDASHGIQFYKCVFSRGNVTSTIGLELGSIAEFAVIDCKFVGNPPNPIGIQLDGTMAIGEIKNNSISAMTTGIAIQNEVSADYGLEINHNIIFRADPNTDDAMEVGVDFRSTVGISHACVIDNFIAADDAIKFHSGYGNRRDHWMCIGNKTVTPSADTMAWESAEE